MVWGFRQIERMEEEHLVKITKSDVKDARPRGKPVERQCNEIVRFKRDIYETRESGCE